MADENSALQKKKFFKSLKKKKKDPKLLNSSFKPKAHLPRALEFCQWAICQVWGIHGERQVQQGQ